MPEIKTRDAVKGTIKTLDKAALAGERMKQAYIRTKDKAEQSVSAAEGNPEEYASDRISNSANTLTYEAAHQFDHRGREAVKTTKDNISTVRERMEQHRADQPKRAAQKQAEKQAKQRAAEAARTTQPPASDAAAMPQIKTRRRDTAVIKTWYEAVKVFGRLQNPPETLLLMQEKARLKRLHAPLRPLGGQPTPRSKPAVQHKNLPLPQQKPPTGQHRQHEQRQRKQRKRPRPPQRLPSPLSRVSLPGQRH
ncbi:MAG: hypothetical protein LUG93_00785 [Lachnospiraceae bacterium]|nr:hypothetical protein [Lachnospiraceae bacterium]